jgi:hypothetical protein
MWLEALAVWGSCTVHRLGNGALFRFLVGAIVGHRGRRRHSVHHLMVEARIVNTPSVLSASRDLDNTFAFLVHGYNLGN